MTELFGRVAAVEIGPPGGTGLRIDGLRIRFDATKVIGAPDTCEVAVWNPSAGTLRALETPGNVTRVLAGYGTAVQLGFGTVVRGSLRVDRTAPDTMVTWRVTDGGADLRDVLLSRAWATGVSASTVIRTLAGDAGIALGNVSPPAAFRYADGFVAIGSLPAVLDEIAADTGCVWSVVDGVLHFWPRNQPRQRTAFVIAPDSGMVGSPVPVDRGQLQVTSLLQPAMRLGDLFRVRSQGYNGDYIVTAVTHRGEAAATGPVADEFVTVAVGRPA